MATIFMPAYQGGYSTTTLLSPLVLPEIRHLTISFAVSELRASYIPAVLCAIEAFTDLRSVGLFVIFDDVLAMDGEDFGVGLDDVCVFIRKAVRVLGLGGGKAAFVHDCLAKMWVNFRDEEAGLDEWVTMEEPMGLWESYKPRRERGE